MKNRNKGIVLSYVNTILNMCTGIVLSTYLIRNLGSAEYGVYQTISAFASYLVLFEFGTGTVMTRNLSLCDNLDFDLKEKTISTISLITVALTVMICIVASFFYFYIDRIYANSLSVKQLDEAKYIFVLVTVYIVINFFSQTINGIILAYEKYSYAPVVNITRNLIRVLLIVGLIKIFKQAVTIAVVDVILSFGIFIYALLYCWRKLKVKISLNLIDKNILKNAMPLCFALFLQTIINQANNNVDKFIIGIKLSPENVTLYSIAMFFYSMFSSITTIPISIYAPQITRATGEGKTRRELADIMIEPSRIISIIGGIVVGGFFVAGKQFIKIAYGNDYVEAWNIALIIMFPMYFNMILGVVINVLNAENKRIIRSLVLGGMAILNIVLTLLMIDKKGVIGAAMATAVAITVGHLIIMNVYYYQKIKIPIFYMYFHSLRGVLGPLLISGSLIYLSTKYIQNVYLSFGVSTVLFLLLFGILFVMNNVNKKEKTLLLTFFKEKKK